MFLYIYLKSSIQILKCANMIQIMLCVNNHLASGDVSCILKYNAGWWWRSSLLMAESQMRMCWGPDRSRFIIPHSSSIMGGRQRSSAGLGDSLEVYGEHSSPNAPLGARPNICFGEFLTAVQGYFQPVQCAIVEVTDVEKQKIGRGYRKSINIITTPGERAGAIWIRGVRNKSYSYI